MIILQICQKVEYLGNSSYDIADAGTEEMWIDLDGVPYVYYTGPGGRYTLLYTAPHAKHNMVPSSLVPSLKSTVNKL